MWPPGGSQACIFLCHSKRVAPSWTTKVVAVKSRVIAVKVSARRAFDGGKKQGVCSAPEVNIAGHLVERKPATDVRCIDQLFSLIILQG